MNWNGAAGAVRSGDRSFIICWHHLAFLQITQLSKIFLTILLPLTTQAFLLILNGVPAVPSWLILWVCRASNVEIHTSWWRIGTKDLFSLKIWILPPQRRSPSLCQTTTNRLRVVSGNVVPSWAAKQRVLKAYSQSSTLSTRVLDSSFEGDASHFDFFPVWSLRPSDSTDTIDYGQSLIIDTPTINLTQLLQIVLAVAVLLS